MSDVAGVKERVQAYLTSVTPVLVDEDGKYSFETENTRVFVSVEAHPNGEVAIVNVMVPVLVEVPVGPDLYMFVAQHTDVWRFGHLVMFEDEDTQTCLLFLCHNLLGDYLDKEELIYAAFGLGEAADRAANEWLDELGGRKLIQE
jgi:hypothetical protein